MILDQGEKRTRIIHFEMINAAKPQSKLLDDQSFQPFQDYRKAVNSLKLRKQLKILSLIEV
uniref:Uncharacterized protein n=1 Tax=Romanomermis culicivorax TaxID=13658 RepID=A0A915I7F2_ROMCU